MGGGTAETKTTTVSKTKEQQDIAKGLTSNFLQKATEQGQVFQGQRVAEFSPLQTGAISGAQNFLSGFASPNQITDPLALETQAATRGILSGATGAQQLGPEAVGDFFRSTVVDPARQRQREDILPGIDESFAGPGFFGSARSQARTESNENLAQQLSVQEQQLQFQNILRNQQLDEAAAGRTAGVIPSAIAAGQAPAVTAQAQIQTNIQQLSGLRDVFGFGEAAQSQEQAQLFAEFQKFTEIEGLRGEALDIVMRVLNESITSTVTEDRELARAGRAQFEQLGARFVGSAIGGYFGGQEGATQGSAAADIKP